MASILSTPLDAGVQAFWEYWLTLPRPKGGLPALSDYFDNVPPELQPNVAVADVHSAEHLVLRLFGTGLVNITGADLTGINPLTVYSESVRRLAGEVAWRAASHPCGYTCHRVFRTISGRRLKAPGIVLPVDIANAGHRAILLFTNLVAALEVLQANEKFNLIQDVEFGSWIDLGAGIPA